MLIFQTTGNVTKMYLSTNTNQILSKNHPLFRPIVNASLHCACLQHEHTTSVIINSLKVKTIHDAACQVSGHYTFINHSVRYLHGIVIGHIMSNIDNILTLHLQNLMYEVSNLLNFRHKKTATCRKR